MDNRNHHPATIPLPVEVLANQRRRKQTDLAPGEPEPIVPPLDKTIQKRPLSVHHRYRPNALNEDRLGWIGDGHDI